MWSATEAVLAYCRAMEIVEHPRPVVAATSTITRLNTTYTGNASGPANNSTATNTTSNPTTANLDFSPPPPPPPPHSPLPYTVTSERYSENFFHSPSQRDSPSQSQASLFYSAHSPHRHADLPQIAQPHNLPALITPHTTAAVVAAAAAHTAELLLPPPAGDSLDQEESQLSSQLHYASICASPSADAYVDAVDGVGGAGGGNCSVAGGSMSRGRGEDHSAAEKAIVRNFFAGSDDISPVSAADSAVVQKVVQKGVNESVNERVPEEVQEAVVFSYSGEQVRRFPSEGMSAVLLQTLVGLARCRGK